MDRLVALFEKHPDICTDTRQIRPGCLFFALKGERFDGNMFASQALEKGAAYAVVDQYRGTDPRCIVVPDVLKALQQLAAVHRSRFTGPVLALTGSNGKTTTKELIHAVLSVRYNVTATQGNLNNHIGVPLSLLKIGSTTEAGLFEMGASHPGEIAFLTDMVKPNAGLITNISGAHLEGFGNLEGVKQCKGALYDYLNAHAGTIFYNADDPVLTEMLEHRTIRDHVIPYGISKQPLHTSLEDGVLVITVSGYPQIRTHLAGLYNTPNVLAALAVARYYGIENTRAAEAVASYIPSNNRSQWIKTGRNALIADAYNANPVSMSLALKNLDSIREGKKCAILADMLELGAYAHKSHRGIVEQVEQMGLDQVFWVGPLFSKAVQDLGAAGMCFARVEDLIMHLGRRPLEGATVLIKGSNGMGLSKLIASGVC
jgi:UDP-N-acetylmuramoyl-tripeptide--D-alanyl-D-alanine ligase